MSCWCFTNYRSKQLRFCSILLLGLGFLLLAYLTKNTNVHQKLYPPSMFYTVQSNARVAPAKSLNDIKRIKYNLMEEILEYGKLLVFDHECTLG